MHAAGLELAAAPSAGERAADALGALRRRIWIVLLAGIVTGATAYALADARPREYTAQVLLLVQPPEVSAPSGTTPPDTQRVVDTTVQLVNGGVLADIAAGPIRKARGSAVAVPTTAPQAVGQDGIVTLTATETSPRMAAAVANAYAEAAKDFGPGITQRRYAAAAVLARERLAALPPTERAGEVGRRLRARISEFVLLGSIQDSRLQLVRRAKAPSSPVAPRPGQRGALGLLLGFVLGIGLVLATERFGARLQSERELEIVTNLPVLAAIPRPRLTPWRRRESRQARQEAYGRLAAALRIAPDASGRTLMVTSAARGDGAETVALGLAAALGGLELDLVLIDADIRDSAVARLLRIGDGEAGAGLTGVVAGDWNLGHALLRFDAETCLPASEGSTDTVFSVLPAGRPLVEPGRSAGVALAAIELVQAQVEADVIVVHAPALTRVGATVPLLETVDEVLLVVREGVTRREEARRASQTLRALGRELVRVVVSGARPEPAPADYAGETGDRRARRAAGGAPC
jgi:Mrp family chromosome partitioning ATPase